jgi:hypothetical protein
MLFLMVMQMEPVTDDLKRPMSPGDSQMEKIIQAGRKMYVIDRHLLTYQHVSQNMLCYDYFAILCCKA